MRTKHFALLLAGLSSGALGTAAHAADASAQAGAPTQLAMATASPEIAAATTATATATAAVDSVADIIVTAEKRETRLQAAPLAITAVSGDALLQRNLNQVNDLNGYVPGLTITKSEGAERIITIRGIGYETAQNPNSQPGVAFHIDGVYIANVLALNQDLLDVDRVEVLRGPQGTVFGETSTGGAINVITKKPVLGVASGSGSVSYGNYNYLKMIGTVNLPVTDTIAVRASVQAFHHDAYGFATAVPGRTRYGLDDANTIGLRGSVLWKPTDHFSALLSGQYFNGDRHASLQKDLSDPDPRPRRVTQDFPAKFRIKTAMVYLTLAQDIGDFAQLKSVSAYQFLNKHQTADNDRLASPFYFDHITYWQDKSKTFTQELTLSSVGKSRLEYTIGGFYLRQRALQNIFEIINPGFGVINPPGEPGIKFATDSPYQHTSAAAYANLTYHLTDQLSLIAGARYNYDRITAQPFQYLAVVPPKAATSRAVTGKVGAEYKLSRDNLLYLTGSRGYKPTGLNFNAPGILIGDTFKKETVNALEIGSKNELFDRKLRLNIAGFYYWYKNLQFTGEDAIPFSGGTANIPKANIYGGEAEFTALPYDGVRIDGTVSYGHGRLKGNYFAIDQQTAAQIRRAANAQIGCDPNNVGCYYSSYVINAVLAGVQNTNGNPVPKLPTWQFQVTPGYSWNMLGGKVTLRGDIIYRGKFNYRLFNTGIDQVPAYTLYNLFLGYEPDDRPWSVSISALNVTNKTGINSKFSDPYGSGTTSVEYVDPRQVFATVNFKF